VGWIVRNAGEGGKAAGKKKKQISTHPHQLSLTQIEVRPHITTKKTTAVEITYIGWVCKPESWV
jgi:hypothetical protein